ncbi:MAG: Asp-tRNA(Asn)/Glu-tRNA(Gln) amidotransferase subunit GatC [Rickettsiales bacterium]|jgi:aspartyl-tRNA(Asn)/glutamyl-tRNA(Gln) amidotransferase subunit C|nr:Asp-tRNA(Asn)/Glu-tRNA(Gln) amidotransferase subunit GatC [Rickettsiales bacterium]
MYFDREKVKANARMVRIGMSDELADKMAGELESVIEWIKGLDDVDVEGIEPMASVSEHPLPRRPDTVKAENAREEILSGAPEADKDGECFAVPKIIE